LADRTGFLSLPASTRLFAGFTFRAPLSGS